MIHKLSKLPSSRNPLHFNDNENTPLTDYDNIFERHVLDRLRIVIETEAQIFHNNSWNGRGGVSKISANFFVFISQLCAFRSTASTMFLRLCTREIYF